MGGETVRQQHRLRAAGRERQTAAHLPASADDAGLQLIDLRIEIGIEKGMRRLGIEPQDNVRRKTQ
jgi:alanine racemase